MAAKNILRAGLEVPIAAIRLDSTGRCNTGLLEQE
jgi:hypothetical protein